MKGKVIQYLNLSEKGSMKQAMANLYKMLRRSENVKGAKYVLISCIDNESEEKPEFLETVYDKTFRASSGRILHYSLTDKSCCLL